MTDEALIKARNLVSGFMLPERITDPRLADDLAIAIADLLTAPQALAGGEALDPNYKWGVDYGNDLLKDLNQLAHAKGTGSLHRDMLQRAYREIKRLAAQPASPLRPTEEQIDAALNAWFKSPPSETDQGLERSMKAALIAADALRPPASPLRGMEDLAPSPCSDLSIGELIEWLDNPQWTNGYLNSDAANHMSAAAELIERFVSSAPPEQPAADPVTGRETIREIVHANAKTTLIGFNEISDQNAEFICDQISRKVELALLSTAPDKQPLRYGEPVWPGNENDDLDKGGDA